MRIKSKVKIVTELDIITARQQVRNEAKTIGFGIVEQARIATATSELAKNIFLYAHEGEIIIEEIEKNGKRGIAITAIDQGPGIADIRKIFEDGYSASGNTGAGIPGVKRLMDSIDIQSEVGMGTRVRVEKWIQGSE